MSEIENPTVAAVEASPSAVDAAVEPTTEPTPLPVAEAAAEAFVEAAADAGVEAPAELVAEAEAAADAGTATAKEGKGGAKAAPAAKGDGARKRAPRKPKPQHRSRSEEFIVPSAEELALVPSEIVRVAVAQQGPVAGKVIGWNQGGFHVVVEGISSFCPRSSMELGAPHEPAQYLDQEYLFRVLRVEEKGRRLVLSRAAVLLDEKRHKIEEARKALQVGAVVKGKVLSLLDFGAFVDLGGVEGLIHVSELRHQRTEHPSEVLTLGQEVEAKIVKLPGKGERVSLSLKALAPSPWDGAGEKWPAGGKFSGKVVRKSDFGWFVELAPGVEALLHPSQLPPGVKAEDPMLAPGAAIEGWVRETDLARQRISLALREVPTGNPWQDAATKFPEGAVVTGTVEKIQPFGAFIVLEPGVTALLPTSEMGLPRGASVGKAYPIGREIKLKVAEVDPRRRRISLTKVDKTLEGSKSDFQSYLKQSRKASGMGALAAAFDRLKD